MPQLNNFNPFGSLSDYFQPTAGGAAPQGFDPTQQQGQDPQAMLAHLMALLEQANAPEPPQQIPVPNQPGPGPSILGGLSDALRAGLAARGAQLPGEDYASTMRDIMARRQQAQAYNQREQGRYATEKTKGKAKAEAAVLAGQIEAKQKAQESSDKFANDILLAAKKHGFDMDEQSAKDAAAMARVKVEQQGQTDREKLKVSETKKAGEEKPGGLTPGQIYTTLDRELRRRLPPRTRLAKMNPKTGDMQYEDVPYSDQENSAARSEAVGALPQEAQDWLRTHDAKWFQAAAPVVEETPEAARARRALELLNSR